MNSSTEVSNPYASAVDRVSKVIAPLFPLRHIVAVNPYMGYSDTDVATAARELQAAHGSKLWMPGAYYAEHYARKEVSFSDLEAAQRKLGTSYSLEALLSWTRQTAPEDCLATFASFLDSAKPGAAWDHWVACQIGQFCAAYYDLNQSTWPMPWKHLPLLEAWKEYASYDASAEAAGVSEFRRLVASLPENTQEAIRILGEELRPAFVSPEHFLIRQAASMPGWAGYVRYRVREHGLRGRADDSLSQFLVIRLAYDAALKRSLGTPELIANWNRTGACAIPDRSFFEKAQLWQMATEIAYQRQVLAKLLKKEPEQVTLAPSLQAVFCIDVRSERYRRHLEAIEPSVQTIGFAGFFGMPVQFSDPSTGETTSRVPALFAPKLNTTLPDEASSDMSEKRELSRAWQGFQHAAASCFTYVEAFGLGAISAAFKPAAKPRCTSAPKWKGVPIEERVTIAENALKGMGLDRNFAPIVVICGHGSANTNNPQASALECGACGGHAGDHNARLAVGLFNDPRIRAALTARGIDIPAETVFIAALHNTTTDEIEIFSDHALGLENETRLNTAKTWFAQAAARARQERDGLLGKSGQWQDRSESIAETRPEFGLANNAAILLAPRALSRGANLDARVFLHDYDHNRDTSLDQLVFLLSAPVVVASWINLQYYASRVDPNHFGSGNKVLHNVCGAIGVIEGNAGDIRPGLSWQSLHDGSKYVHQPLRLTVLAAAPRAKLDAALVRAPSAEELIRNGWIHLVAIEGTKRFSRCADGSWTEL